MLEAEWNETLAKWAHARNDIQAFVQIGSRVQADGRADAWSDYDYQLITSCPGRYLDGAFARQISRCWAVGTNRAFGNATKISAVYDGALEAEFVILKHWEVVVATTALRWPNLDGWWPRILRRGIEDLQGVAGSGWRMIKGGSKWEQRYGRLRPFQERLTHDDFDRLCDEFWSHFVWAVKKAERGEFLAAQRAFHEILFERALSLLQEEGLLEDKMARPRGRRAEQWLSPARLQSVRIPTSPDRDSLLAAFDRVAALFADVSDVVARKNCWDCPSYPEARAWLTKHTSRSA
jgi:hypothetical protein